MKTEVTSNTTASKQKKSNDSNSDSSYITDCSESGSSYVTDCTSQAQDSDNDEDQHFQFA